MSNTSLSNSALNLSSTSQFHPRNWPILQAFCGLAGCLLVTLIVLYILAILTMLRRADTLSGSRVLLLHQLLIEAQMTMFYWPTNALFLQFIFSRPTPTAALFCRHFTYGFMITLTAIWWGLLMIALNRFIAVVRPHNYRQWVTRPALAVQITSPWVVGILCMLYHYVGGDGGFFFAASTRGCHVPRGAGLNVASVFYSYLPLVAVCLLYVVTFLVVWRNNRLRKMKVTSGEQRKLPGRRVRLAKMLFGVSLVHCVCFVTVPIMYSIVPDIPTRFPIVRQWTNLVTYIGYLSTPISVFVMNQDYRQAAKDLLRCRETAASNQPQARETSNNRTRPAVTVPSGTTLNDAAGRG